jgi:multiple antibiotic resistance protein
MHRADLNEFVGATLLIVGAVLPVINPVGGVPLFLDMTDGLDPARRNKLAARVAVSTRCEMPTIVRLTLLAGT